MKEIANKLEEIKDAVYELEGLLELARLRGDKAQELLPLMNGKLREINRLFEMVSISDKETPVVPPLETTEEADDNEALAEATRFEEEEDSYEPEDSYEREKSLEPEDSIEIDKEIVTVTPIPEEIPFEQEEVVTEKQESETPITIQVNRDAPKPAFCINDRFRFRRELFGGSDADFSSAMDLVATMDNYEEAEQYFIEELGWDVEDPNVADFLAIIERYFDR